MLKLFRLKMILWKISLVNHFKINYRLNFHLVTKYLRWMCILFIYLNALRFEFYSQHADQVTS